MTTATTTNDGEGADSDDRSAAAHLARNLTGLRHARGLTQ